MFLRLVHSAAAASDQAAPFRSRIAGACTCGPGRLPSRRLMCLTCAGGDRYAREVEVRQAFERKRVQGGWP